MNARRVFAAAVVCSTLLLPAKAAARELHWSGLTVDARLEDDGTLAVSERHDMVFTGDWNGGERNFDLRLGHRLVLDGVYRLDASTGGVWRRLEEGSLDDVDHWQWTDSDTLRWRSRAPSDPEFDATAIGYRLDYRLQGILLQEGSGFILDHDFAFPDRDGPIERFSLDLELGPQWRATGSPQLHVEAGPLGPGSSYVLRTHLAHLGGAPPANATVRRLSKATRAGAVGVAALGALALWGWAWRRERVIGRLASLPDSPPIDRAWLEQHLLSMAPEEVGAAWDDSIAAPEVTAILARLQLEGKLSSRVEESKFLFIRSTNLHMSLLVPRANFSPTERKLIDSLFPKGDHIDTASLRKHYESSGLDPAAKIRDGLKGQLERRPAFAGKRAHPPRLPSFLLSGAGILLLAVSIAMQPPNAGWPVLLAFALLFSWIPTIVGAALLRNRVMDLAGPAIVIAIGQCISLAALGTMSAVPEMPWTALAGDVLLFLGLTRTAATAMQTRQTAERIARRRELARARTWFSEELSRPKPRLEDAWLPYLVAFGLAPQMDRWFKAYGDRTGTTSIPSFGGGSGGSSGGSWTGGGGSFGGGGASSSWAAAAGGLAAGVSSPSSSSGGGGGGGGGGSSGGGGGGCW